MSLKFLSATVTQGSADAFATVSMATGLANLNAGFRVRAIDFQFPLLVGADCQVDLQLLRRVPTAIVAATDRTLIWSKQRVCELTTSGMIVYSLNDYTAFDRDMDLLIVEDPIYFSIDSNGTSATNNGRCRVYYEEVRLSETAKLAALTESLNA